MALTREWVEWLLASRNDTDEFNRGIAELCRHWLATQALITKWREDAKLFNDDTSWAYSRCVTELKAALTQKESQT